VRHDILFGDRPLLPRGCAPAWMGSQLLPPRQGMLRPVDVHGRRGAGIHPLTSQSMPQALSSGLVAAHPVRAALGGNALAILDYPRTIARTGISRCGAPRRFI
jgi:hypothetical protein